MHTPTNTALVQSLYAAFGRGDIQFILEHLHEEVTWTMEGPAILPYAGARHGVNEVKGFFHALATTQSGHKLTTTDFVASGDKVATFGRYAGTVTSTGKAFDSAVAHLFEIRDGKVVSFVDVGDTAAMAAAYQGAAAAAH